MDDRLPRLVALSGPQKDTLYPLATGETGIGREGGNSVRIGDPALSRRHCVMVREGGRVFVRDLESLNGTFINGVPVRERELRHGDRILAGKTHFLYLDREGETSVAEEVPVARGTISTTDTIRLKLSDVRLLRPE